MLDDRDDGSAIDVRGVTKHFGALCVLDRISCRFEKGRTTVVIGPSGSGKSTLARCICGLETYDAGSITLFGEDVASLRSRPRAMSRRTGMIFQHFNLWPHMTALENVAFAPRRCLKMDEGQARELASNLLERVGLKNKARHKPGRLSGGEQQRVAIARALANDPKILISDEATSALDPKTTKQILALLQDLNQKLGLTIVLITHEMQIIKDIANRVAVMQDGQLIEEGSVLDIFSNPNQDLTRDFITTATGINEAMVKIEKQEIVQNLAPNSELCHSYPSLTNLDPSQSSALNYTLLALLV